MCGRFALTTSRAVLSQLFRTANDTGDVAARYNIAPTQTVPVIVVSESGERELVEMRWGLVPSWAKDPAIGNRLINARSETAADKPAFRHALRRRRCIVPASGFYEWRKLDSRTKQPYYIRRADGQPLAIAGLWESWTDRNTGEHLRTFTILTMPANEQVAALHDRMPVLLDDESIDRWLDPQHKDAAMLCELMQPEHGPELAMHPVSTRVNKPANDDPSLVEPQAL